MRTVEKSRRAARGALGEKERLYFQVLCEASSLVLISLLLSYRQGGVAGNEALGREDLFLEYASERDDSGFSRFERLLLDFLPEAALYMNCVAPGEDRGLVQTVMIVAMFLACLKNPPPEARDPRLADGFMAGYEDWYAAHGDAAMPVPPADTSLENGKPI